MESQNMPFSCILGTHSMINGLPYHSSNYIIECIHASLI